LKEEAFGVGVRRSSGGLWALGQIMFDVVPSAFVAELLVVVQTSSRLELQVDDLPKRDDLRTSFATKTTKYKPQHN